MFPLTGFPLTWPSLPTVSDILTHQEESTPSEITTILYVVINEITITCRNSAHITVQPASFQLSNYNVFPPPEVHFGTKLPTNIKIYISLIASNSSNELEDGFQYGETKTVRAGSDKVTLTGTNIGGEIKIPMTYNISNQH